MKCRRRMISHWGFLVQFFKMANNKLLNNHFGFVIHLNCNLYSSWTIRKIPSREPAVEAVKEVHCDTSSSWINVSLPLNIPRFRSRVRMINWEIMSCFLCLFEDAVPGWRLAGGCNWSTSSTHIFYLWNTKTNILFAWTSCYHGRTPWLAFGSLSQWTW